MLVRILERLNRFYNSKGVRDKQSGTIEKYIIKGVNNILGLMCAQLLRIERSLWHDLNELEVFRGSSCYC